MDSLATNIPQLLLMIAIGCLVVIIIIIAFVGMRARDLEHRMDIVANERRGLSTTATNLTGAKTEQSELIKKIVDSLNLRSHIGIGKAKPLLISAGFRGMQAEITFMFARLACCILFFVLTLFYIFFVGMWDIPRIMAVVIALFAGFAGLWAPHVWVQNLVQKRQVEIKKAWPDCLDLMLICVDAGMSVEQAFRRVADEIGPQSVALAEEFALSTAELSYLPNRRMAYDNLGKRIGLEIARNLGLALIQAEKYGTPVGNTLRVLAQESRDMRIMEAERKAAALAVKLTIPAMIFFFLPIFVIIFVPVVIQALDQGLI